jgi:glycosyltransferase involved in cell wall biosynthesis
MKQIMKIALANRWFPPDAVGGVATYNRNIALALQQLGVDVIGVCRGDPTDRTPSSDGLRLVRVREPYHRAQKLPVLGSLFRAFDRYRYSRELAATLLNLCQSEKIDLIEFAEIDGEGYSFLRGDRVALPRVVVRCHTPGFVLRDHYNRQGEMRNWSSLIGRMEQLSIHRADGRTAPSFDMANRVITRIGLPERSILPIPNAVDTGRFPLRKDRDDRGPVRIIHIGRMERVKGVFTLADALRKLFDDCERIECTFIGGDQRMPNGESCLDQVKKRLGSAVDRGHLRFLGKVDDSQMMDELADSDLAVVPSLNYESFSYTCAEAMTVGLPVVASRIGGIPETVIEGECGLLITPGNSDELAQQLRVLIRDKDLRERMGVSGRNSAINRFGLDATGRQTLDYYREVLGS